MGRKYKRDLFGRSYCAYSASNLQKALDAIRKQGISQRVAATQYQIPRSTLKNKLKGVHSKVAGGQTVFSADDEKLFVEHMIVMSNYGFPVDTFDLRMIVKSYADRRGLAIRQFRNNMPGIEWTSSFLKRHRNLTVRFASNIKRKRAEVSPDTIDEYFLHMNEELDGVAPENIWNFDETNLTDEPGNKRVITKRGCKYPERIINATKTATSLMLCGNAAGRVLPPYVVYKADSLWSTWTNNGPPKTRYNRTKSGWFDAVTFEDWFYSQLLPELKNSPGKKVVIGDNLSSHINVNVLQTCRDNNVAFIGLPPNSTHLTQPLDVAYFRPMKIAWRKILTEWKETTAGRKAPSLPKDKFPQLLKSLMHKLEESGCENLKSGFRKTGIYPLDKAQVLARLPSSNVIHDPDSTSPSLISQSFIEHLQKARSGNDEPTRNAPVRRKKLPVVAGKSICCDEIIDAINHADTTATSSKTRVTTGSKKRKNVNDDIAVHKKPHNDPPASCSDHLEAVVTTDENNAPFEQSSDSDTSTSISEEYDSDTDVEPDDPVVDVDSYVVVKYDDNLYPGKVINTKKSGYEVSCMAKSGLNWKWPQKPDILTYNKSDIVKLIGEPVKISGRGLYKVSEMITE